MCADVVYRCSKNQQCKSPFFKPILTIFTRFYISQLLVHERRLRTQSKLLSVFAASVYTQAYNQVLVNQQQQQAAQLIASANPAVVASSGITGLGLLGLAAQKEGGFLVALWPLFIFVSP